MFQGTFDGGESLIYDVSGRRIFGGWVGKSSLLFIDASMHLHGLSHASINVRIH
jgi:hypothetical protein